MIGINKHSIYGLFYIVLLPVAFLLGLTVALCMVPAFANHILLLPLFIVACFVIYTIATFAFYIKAIRQQIVCKTSLRDLIRINAFVLIIPAAFLLLQGILIVSDPGIISTAIPQLRSMQQQMPDISDAALAKLILRMYYFLVVYALVIIIHVFYTFRLLKQYQSSFITTN